MATKNGSCIQILIYVGPTYLRASNRYFSDHILCASHGTLFSCVKRGSELEKLAARRPSRERRLRGPPTTRCALYPSSDTLGRERCRGLSAELTDNEKRFLDEREPLIVHQDATGELLGLFFLRKLLR